MKSLSAFLALTLFANVAFADCDYSKDVKKLDESSYSYTKDCHKAVGAALENLESRTEQVGELKKQIELKDLMVVKERERADLWQVTAKDLDKQVTTLEKMESQNKVLYFFLGVAATGLAVWGAGQLSK